MKRIKLPPLPLPYLLILIALLAYGAFQTVAPLSKESAAQGTVVDITRPHGSATAYTMVVKVDAPHQFPVYYTFDLPENLDVYEVETWESWKPAKEDKARRDSLRQGQQVAVLFSARTFNVDDPTQLPALITPTQVQIITSDEGN